MGLSGTAMAPTLLPVGELEDGATEGAWGILGGTFDPLHYAHLAISERVRDVLRLAGILFVPAGAPPHKRDRPISPAEDRVAMVAAGIADNPAFRLCRVEVDRPGLSYMADTLAQLIADPPVPDASRGYVLILSAEAMLGLPGWHEPQRILEHCRVAVVPRLGYRAPARPWLAEHFPGQESRVIFVDGPELGHSASQIRRLASEGRSIRYLVPPAVEAYILDHSLYPPELWRKN